MDMAQKLDPRQTFEFRELLISKMVQSEALMNVFRRKDVPHERGVTQRNRED
jgi:hypothetical protein